MNNYYDFLASVIWAFFALIVPVLLLIACVGKLRGYKLVRDEKQESVGKRSRQGMVYLRTNKGLKRRKK